MEKKLKLIPFACSLLALLISGVFFFIWVFEPSLKEFSANSMKVNTSLGIFLLALSVFLLRDETNFTRQKMGKILAGSVLVIGLLTGFQYLTGANFGIDEFLIKDFFNGENQFSPGRMSPLAAISFIFLSLGLLFQDLRIRNSKYHIASYFLMPAILINFLALVGYIFGTSSLYQIGPFVPITWQSAICLELIGVGALFSRPSSGIAIITSTEAGGAMARMLLPVIFFFPLIFGWLRLQGQRIGFFNLEEGISFLVVALIVLFVVVIIFCAKVLNHLGLERKKFLESEKDARREVELEKEKLHSLFLQAPAIISLTRGPKHIFELFNNEARKLVGGRDLTNLSIRECLPELEGIGYFEALDSVFLTGETIVINESPASLVQADGLINHHYLNVVLTPWFDFNGKVAGILNVTIDVTEQVLARLKVEEALRDRDAYITAKKETERALKQLTEELEFKVEERTRELSDTLLILNEANIILSQEMEQRKKVEAQIRHTLEKEKELSELKSRFVSMASHEFRTPLGGILTSVSLISSYKKSEDEAKRDKHIQNIKKSVKSLTIILNDFLSLDKLNQGKMTSNPIQFSLDEFLSEILEEFENISEKEQRFVTNQKEKGLILFQDKDMLRNIIINLLSNAVKYSPAKTKIQLTTNTQDSQLILQVQDEGIGIPKEDQKHLFEVFFRAKNATNIQGTGLGLNIVKRYLDMMNGELKFASIENIGTTFTVILPLENRPTSIRPSVELLVPQIIGSLENKLHQDK